MLARELVLGKETCDTLTGKKVISFAVSSCRVVDNKTPTSERKRSLVNNNRFHLNEPTVFVRRFTVAKQRDV